MWLKHKISTAWSKGMDGWMDTRMSMVQSQFGWGLGQPGLVLNMEVGGPAFGRRVGAS